MTWMGPTYAMWSDTVDEMDEVIAHANRTNQSLEQWKAYAKRLETALIDVADKHRKGRENYIDKAGAEAGQAALKRAALAEIKDLNPSSKLLDPNYRKTIYDAERQLVAAKLQNK